MNLEFRVNAKKGKVVRQGLENLKDKIMQIGRSRLHEVAKEALAVLKIPGNAIKYPVQWDSERQKRAYFATDAFTIKGKRPTGYVNKHIPYKRTGKHVKAWKIKSLPYGYALVNTNETIKYLVGKPTGAGQSRIHKGRWMVFRDVYENVVKELPKRVRESLIQIVQRAKGTSIAK